MRVRPIWNDWKPAKREQWRRRYNLPSSAEYPELYDRVECEHLYHDIWSCGPRFYLREPLPEAPMPWDEGFGEWSPEQWDGVEVAELNRRIAAIRLARCKKAHPARFRRAFVGSR